MQPNLNFNIKLDNFKFTSKYYSDISFQLLILVLLIMHMGWCWLVVPKHNTLWKPWFCWFPVCINVFTKQGFKLKFFWLKKIERSVSSGEGFLQYYHWTYRINSKAFLNNFK